MTSILYVPDIGIKARNFRIGPFKQKHHITVGIGTIKNPNCLNDGRTYTRNNKGKFWVENKVNMNYHFDR